jgi:hypothetical protein
LWRTSGNLNRASFLPPVRTRKVKVNYSARGVGQKLMKVMISKKKEEQHILIQSIESLKKLMTEEFRHINDRMDAYEAKIVSFIQSDMSYLSISIHSFIYHPYSL